MGDVAQLAVVAAMFHLFTHAFFKALLFLASGSVMHAMGDVIDMRRFGGLRHRLPFTHAGLSRSVDWRLPASFRSRASSARTRSCWHSSRPRMPTSWGWVYAMIYWVAILTAFMTAFYTGRAYFMTFWGTDKLPSPDDPEAPRQEPKSGVGEHDSHGTVHEEPVGHAHGHDHVGHESPPVMTISAPDPGGLHSAGSAVCLRADDLFEHHLHETLGSDCWAAASMVRTWPPHSSARSPVCWASAWLTSCTPQRSPIPGQLAIRFRPLYEASLHKFYVDEIYEWVIGQDRHGRWPSSANSWMSIWWTGL